MTPAAARAKFVEALGAYGARCIGALQENIGRDQLEDELFNTKHGVLAAADEMVEAERERCAVIVEGLQHFSGAHNDDHAYRKAAAAIRGER